MKIDRYNLSHPTPMMRARFTAVCFTRKRSAGKVFFAFFTLFLSISIVPSLAQSTDPGSHSPTGTTEQSAKQNQKNFSEDSTRSHQAATKLLRRIVFQLAAGPAFESKVRERVWTTGREVVGVGTYEQSGNKTGQFHLQMTMHDGDDKHTLEQISDGRLAWTRTQIAGEVSLRRVDVSRLDEWSNSPDSENELALRLRVGGWIEMLESLEQNRQLHVDSATMNEQSVWVITATMSKEQTEELMRTSGRTQWPVLYPAKIRVAISKTGSKETGFGKFLPVRFEYWSQPMADPAEPKTDQPPEMTERMISLIELYAIREISPPPIERFRFENRDAEVNFTNETSRYLKQFGVEVADTGSRLF
ncbi:hypothetical protein [Novipirellula aureliae]|nr:hypothetical protein [Novipirellula aureliae]